MPTTSPEPTVTVRFTIEVDRTLKLRQDNKPKHYSNVEWAKQQVEDALLELEMGLDGRVQSNYRFLEGCWPDEICDDDDVSPASPTPTEPEAGK